MKGPRKRRESGMMEDLGLGAVSAAVGAIYRDEDLGDWGWGGHTKFSFVSVF